MFDALLVCLVTQWYITIIKAGWRWCIMLKRPSLSVLSDSPVHHLPGRPMSWLFFVVPFSSALSLRCLSEQF